MKIQACLLCTAVIAGIILLSLVLVPWAMRRVVPALPESGVPKVYEVETAHAWCYFIYSSNAFSCVYKMGITPVPRATPTGIQW